MLCSECAFERVSETLRSAVFINVTVTVLTADGRNGDVLPLYARNANKLSDNQMAHVLALCGNAIERRRGRRARRCCTISSSIVDARRSNKASAAVMMTVCLRNTRALCRRCASLTHFAGRGYDADAEDDFEDDRWDWKNMVEVARVGAVDGVEGGPFACYRRSVCHVRLAQTLAA